jgi:hypothetical protein
MVLADKEREKIQSPKNSVKLASSQRERHKLSNGVNGSSNIVTDQKIFADKVSGQPSLVNRDESTFVLLTSTSVWMTLASVHCTWNMQRESRVMLTSAW